MRKSTRKNMSGFINNVYLDSNVFIFAACSGDETGSHCKRLLGLIVRGKIKCLTSCLAFDEVFFKIKKIAGSEHAVIFTENFLAMPNLIFADVTPSVMASALELIKKYKILPRDAIHAATALAYKAAAIVSDDRDFSKVAELNWLGIADFIKQLENS